MTLDPTVREANVRDSIKKYFVDNLVKTEGLQVTFDKGLSTPRVQGNEVDRWIAIKFGDLFMGNLSRQMLTIFCCTKKDAEGFKLAQLRDKVINYLFDSDATDGNARITLYRSHETEAWTVIGGMVIVLEMESNFPPTEDGTKFKTIDVTILWGAKC